MPCLVVNLDLQSLLKANLSGHLSVTAILSYHFFYIRLLCLSFCIHLFGCGPLRVQVQVVQGPERVTSIFLTSRHIGAAGKTCPSYPIMGGGKPGRFEGRWPTTVTSCRAFTAKMRYFTFGFSYVFPSPRTLLLYTKKPPRCVFSFCSVSFSPFQSSLLR